MYKFTLIPLFHNLYIYFFYKGRKKEGIVEKKKKYLTFNNERGKKKE